ncbi:hypothetical protein Hanom_Chr17g01576361 [Helianthus anomalus]
MVIIHYIPYLSVIKYTLPNYYGDYALYSICVTYEICTPNNSYTYQATMVIIHYILYYHIFIFNTYQMLIICPITNLKTIHPRSHIDHVD